MKKVLENNPNFGKLLDKATSGGAKFSKYKSGLPKHLKTLAEHVGKISKISKKFSKPFAVLFTILRLAALDKRALVHVRKFMVMSDPKYKQRGIGSVINSSRMHSIDWIQHFITAPYVEFFKYVSMLLNLEIHHINTLRNIFAPQLRSVLLKYIKSDGPINLHFLLQYNYSKHIPKGF